MSRFQISLRSAAIGVAVLCGVLAVVAFWERRCQNPDEAQERLVAELVGKFEGTVYWDALPKGPVSWLSGKDASRQIGGVMLTALDNPAEDSKKVIELLDQIATLKHIGNLYLSASADRTYPALPLTRLPQSLQRISFSCFTVDDDDLAALEALPELSDIRIQLCKLQVSRERIKRLPQSLERLSLETDAPAEWIESLSEHKKLYVIELQRCKEVSDELIPLLLKSHVRHLGARPRHFSKSGREELKAAGIVVHVAGKYLDD